MFQQGAEPSRSNTANFAGFRRLGNGKFEAKFDPMWLDFQPRGQAEAFNSFGHPYESGAADVFEGAAAPNANRCESLRSVVFDRLDERRIGLRRGKGRALRAHANAE
jgi:hypothetical protein